MQLSECGCLNELSEYSFLKNASRLMKILYISQYFPPEMGAPAARAAELSRHWAAAGHDVTVLTGFPESSHGRCAARVPRKNSGVWWFTRKSTESMWFAPGFFLFPTGKRTSGC